MSSRLRSALEERLRRLQSMYPEVDHHKKCRPGHFNEPMGFVGAALDLIARELDRIREAGGEVSEELARRLASLRERASAWRELKAFDIVEAEHENEIIDALRGLEEVCDRLEIEFRAPRWSAFAARVAKVDPLPRRLSKAFTRTSVHEYGKGNKCDVLAELWYTKNRVGDGFSAVAADVDRDGRVEVVHTGYDIVRRIGYVFCLGWNGTIKWYREMGGLVIYIALCDVDGDGYVEVVAPCDDGYVHCLAHDGSIKWSYYSGYDSSWAAPAVADVDRDGELEVLFGDNRPSLCALRARDGSLKWMYECPADADAPACIAVADVDRDGEVEVVFGCLCYYVICVDGSGDAEWVYVLPEYAGSGGCSLYDVDGDGYLEVLCSSDWPPGILCLAHDGTLRWWYAPDVVPWAVVWVPSIAVHDVDGDGSPEALAGCEDCYFYCLDARSGRLKWRFETGDAIYTCGSIADYDGDGLMEVFFGSCDYFVYVLEGDGSLKTRRKMISSLHFLRDVACVDDVDGDGYLEVCFVHLGGLMCLKPSPA